VCVCGYGGACGGGGVAGRCVCVFVRWGGGRGERGMPSMA
jgi:hypothetical protein